MFTARLFHSLVTLLRSRNSELLITCGWRNRCDWSEVVQLEWMMVCTRWSRDTKASLFHHWLVHNTKWLIKKWLISHCEVQNVKCAVWWREKSSISVIQRNISVMQACLNCFKVGMKRKLLEKCSEMQCYTYNTWQGMNKQGLYKQSLPLRAHEL